MSANRVAALIAVLTQVGVIAAAIAGAFPGKYGDTIAIGAALLTKAAVVVKFLDGSQKYDALIARAARTETTHAGV